MEKEADKSNVKRCEGHSACHFLHRLYEFQSGVVVQPRSKVSQKKHRHQKSSPRQRLETRLDSDAALQL